MAGATRRASGRSATPSPEHGRLPYALSRTGELTALRLKCRTFPDWEELDPSLVVSVDCSDGFLEDLSGLARFPRLTSVVADANAITGADALPDLPLLQVLSLNKNRIRNFTDFAREAKEKFPNLKHLSLLGNPCCPSEVFGESRQDYDRYFEYVSLMLDQLESLDSNTTRMYRRKAPTEPATVVIKVASEMLMVRFSKMMAEWEAALQRGDDEKPLTYLKVKSKLIDEFGRDAFELKKDLIHERMRKTPSRNQTGGGSATPSSSVASTPARPRHGESMGDDGTGASLLSATTPRRSTSAASYAASPWGGRRGYDNSSADWATSGDMLVVRVERGNKLNPVGFKIIGGSDRRYGGTFVEMVKTGKAAQLQVGDRILAVNGVGLLDKHQDDAERILQTTFSPDNGTSVCEIVVLRPLESEWIAMREKFGGARESTHHPVRRPLAMLPLIKHSTAKYLGALRLYRGWRYTSSGDIVCCSLRRHSPGEGVGIRMGGSFEIGGIFVTGVKPGSAADEAEDEDGNKLITVGCRILEVAGKSVLLATQAEAAKLITKCHGVVSLVLQKVNEEQWCDIQAQAADDYAVRSLALAQKAVQAAEAAKEEAAAADAYNEAISAYKDILKHCTDVSTACNAADYQAVMAVKCQALSGLGAIYIKQKNFEEAINCHQWEAEECADQGYVQAGARALNTVGVLYRVLERADEAVVKFKQEKELLENSFDYVGLCRACSSLGLTHGKNMGDFRTAVSHHAEALQYARQAQDRAAQAREHANLAISKEKLGELEQASRQHEIRLEISRGLGDVKGVITALRHLCRLAERQNKKDKVLNYKRELAAMGKRMSATSRPSSARPPSRSQARQSRQATKRSAAPVAIKQTETVSQAPVAAEAPVIVADNAVASSSEAKETKQSWASLIPDNVVAADLVPPSEPEVIDDVDNDEMENEEPQSGSIGDDELKTASRPMSSPVAPTAILTDRSNSTTGDCGNEVMDKPRDVEARASLSVADATPPSPRPRSTAAAPMTPPEEESQSRGLDTKVSYTQFAAATSLEDFM